MTMIFKITAEITSDILLATHIKYVTGPSFTQISVLSWYSVPSKGQKGERQILTSN